MKRGSGEDRPLSKKEEALLDAILSTYLKGEEDAEASLSPPGLMKSAPTPFERPSDEAVEAYLLGNATNEQKSKIIAALNRSTVFCEELLQIAEDLQSLRSDRKEAAFAAGSEPVVPGEFRAVSADRKREDSGGDVIAAGQLYDDLLATPVPEPVYGRKPKGRFFDRLRRLLGRPPRHEPKRSDVMGPMPPKSEPWSIDALKEENLKLSRALGELSMLNVLTREIGAAGNREAIIHRIIRQALESVCAEQAVVNLVSRAPIEAKTYVRERVTSSDHKAFHLDKELLGRMYFHKQPVLSNDPQKDERIGRAGWDPSVRSILAVPLLIGSELSGVLVVYNKKDDKGFAEEDQRILTLIATQSAQIIENARLYGEIKKELELASAIQLLMPQEPPSVPGYDIFGQSVPSEDVGGAYFDFIPIEGDRIGICLGDVTGTGITASLLVAGLQATLRGQTLADPSARETIRRSNHLLYRSTDGENFATLFYGLLNPEDHTLAFSNAGHQFPFLLSLAKVKRLETGGMVLGVVDDLQFDEETVKMKPGDVLVMFSDGIIDAFDESETEFGEARLAEIIEKHRDEPANMLASRILKAVREYTGAVPQEDDQALVVVKRKQAA